MTKYNKKCLIIDIIAILVGIAGIFLAISGSDTNNFSYSLIGCLMMVIAGFVGLTVGYYRKSYQKRTKT